MATHIWVVDTVHSDKIVLVCDDGRAATASPTQLPDGLEDRMVLEVESDAQGQPDWTTANVDAEETDRRRKQSADFVEKLRKSDEHGFLQSPE